MRDTTRLGPREAVVDVPLAHGRFHGLRVDTPSLFALAGSFRTAPAVDCGELLLQRLVAALVLCGTRRRNQFEIAELLESRGATLSFESELHRVAFSARACVDDLPLVVELLSDSLREPAFDAATLATEQARLIAELRYRAADPATIAGDALSRLMYPVGHPRYQAELAEQIVQIERFTVDDLRRYQQQHFAANDLCIVAVGDLDPVVTATLIDHHLGEWSPCATPVGGDVAVPKTAARTVRVAAPGRENFEVAQGHRLAIRCDDPDYMALWMANQILGANFRSRLVRAVREQRGLTYSIYSELVKPEREFDGHWQFGLSLSPDKLDAGIAATRAEIERFVEGGVGAQELAAKQVEAIGAFQISLATLGGLSETILFGAERGWGAQHVREFAGRIERVTTGQLNRSIREHLRPSELCAVVAGPPATTASR